MDVFTIYGTVFVKKNAADSSDSIDIGITKHGYVYIYVYLVCVYRETTITMFCYFYSEYIYMIYILYIYLACVYRETKDNRVLLFRCRLSRMNRLRFLSQTLFLTVYGKDVGCPGFGQMPPKTYFK